MKDEDVVEVAARALEAAHRAWHRAHRDATSSPMARTAAIPATGIIAAAILDDPAGEAGDPSPDAERAVRIARRAWERTHRDPPGNPIAATAEKSVIGIVAAGVFRYLRRLEPVAGSSPRRMPGAE